MDERSVIFQRKIIFPGNKLLGAIFRMTIILGEIFRGLPSRGNFQTGSFPCTVNMNSFLYDAINIFCCKRLEYNSYAWIAFLCIFVVCDEQFNSFQRMLPKFASFSIFVCHKSWCLNKEIWTCKSKLILISIKIYKNRFSFQNKRS